MRGGGDQSVPVEVKPLTRRFNSPHQSTPRAHLLSNGSYSVMLTAAGSGYSRWRDIAVTRWREDVTCDSYGSYVFLRDVFNGHVWSAGYQPSGREPENYAVAFADDWAEFTRNDGPIRTRLEVLVSPEDDAEVRRVTLTNQGRGAREIEVTTYCEVVLASAASDSAHPAFSKMFVQTEFAAERAALLATRRQRDPGQAPVWLVHFSCLEGTAVGGVQFETDRARFLGRGHDVRHATSIMDARPLSNTVGTVLDPVLALRRRVRIEPGQTAQIAFWTGIAASRAQALALVAKYGDAAAFERAKTLAWAQAQVQLQKLGVDAGEAAVFQDIGGRLLYCDPGLRAPRDILDANRLGQAALWSIGLSGDLPILLAEIDATSDLDFARQLMRGRAFLQSKGLVFDLVFLNIAVMPDADALQPLLEAIAGSSGKVLRVADAGAAHAGAAQAVSAASLALLRTAARVVVAGRNGPLNSQLARAEEAAPLPRQQRENSASEPEDDAVVPSGLAAQTASLEYFNGLGGFDGATNEYVILLEEGQWTPAPWINVIANPDFGVLISADGCGSSWSLNAQQNQITPWCNDPVSNTPAEVVYLRDEKSGDLWSATPLPIRERSTYVTRHGFGYTRSQHISHEISLELLQFVPLRDPIKIAQLTLTNLSGEARQLSVTHYVDWVLGNQNNRSAPFTITQIDAKTGALLARNPWGADFSGRVAFMDLNGRQQHVCADRSEFIGRHGTLSEPAALLNPQPLSNRVGGGLDACGALQMRIDLEPGETTEVVLLLGEESSAQAATALIERYRAADLKQILLEVKEFWQQTLGAIQVQTPDRSVDLLLNGWLLYQTLACRVWGRTAFYQSSGAYGFRDQLQDVMALCVAAPAVTREHLLRAGARQFVEGDVQHWWLPTTGQGIKTKVADDRIWLAYVTAHYLEVTADHAVLDEQLPFLLGGPLAAGSLESFSAPQLGPSASLYEHCARGLDSSLEIGAHGLPLFGTGDWNDGMNRVGIGGQGESVWMGWFLHAALMRFAPIAEGRGAAAQATAWRSHAFALQQAIEREAWDGDWYRRGYYDDGSPLGSVSSDECRIDSIAQSWAVISGAGDRGRAVRAMSAVNAQLVNHSGGLLQLFTPAFDHSAHDPGYIKAYPPGLRENGGQYTHASTWSVLAFALLGDGDRAGELFSLLNPINHSSTRAGIHRYKVEPYVICADVYSAPPHVGRGGWTWYTGSAGWMYRVGIEGILGVHVRGDRLVLDPCIPRGWSGFEFTYKYRSSRYRISVKNPRGVNRGIVQASMDGQELPAGACEIKLIDDGRYHYGQVTLG
jgi:cyclic beta-1,2-glucan synthetase